jgi:hypothetical protein
MLTQHSKERTTKRRQRSELIKKFGIHADQYEAIAKEQNYLCAICEKPEPCNRSLAVDHCHSTNKVRGLLCTNCNMALGKFQDNVAYLKKAIDYMERDFSVPDVEDSIVKINHNDRPNWKMLVTTPDGVFPSLQHAGRHYNVNATTIRSWCLPGKYKKEDFSCQKMYISLNQLKEQINVKD